MEDVLPWAEYQRTLLPMTGTDELSDAEGRQLQSMAAFNYASYMEQLEVGLFQTEDGEAYQLVQLGDDVPECERLITERGSAESDASWHTPRESRRSVFTYERIFTHLVDERTRRWQRDNELGLTTNFIYWQASKLLHLSQLETNDWAAVVAALSNLQAQGFTNQEIHDILFHYKLWAASNRIEAEMPRDIVWRMYGLAPVIEAGFHR
jgi:hypothetical protein